jgi:RimJ/RimL family protein N-acetyltransferase
MSSTIFYLEMRSPSELQPSGVRAGFEFVEICRASENSRLYREVGSSWQWEDRLSWSLEKWEEWVNRTEVITWHVFFQGEEAGYVELERQEGGCVEIVYFGLVPGMIGRGLGGGMLTLAVGRIWEMEGTKRVWLHTCTEDHPAARVNYEKRGFRLFRTEEG